MINLFTMSGTVLFALAGLLWGVREYFFKEPSWFEKLSGVSKTHFMGSEQWRRKYKGFDPKNGNAFPLSTTFPINDYHHSSAYAIKFMWCYGIALTLKGIGILSIGFWQLTTHVLGLYIWIILAEGVLSWSAFNWIKWRLKKKSQAEIW